MRTTAIKYTAAIERNYTFSVVLVCSFHFGHVPAPIATYVWYRASCDVFRLSAVCRATHAKIRR